MKKFYTVYKITNLMNGKIYFGQHVTTNILDDYMGSGTDLVKDQEKYGIHNFKKEIIDVFNNFKDMNDLERKLVDENINEDIYNLMPGGAGVRSINLDDEMKDKFDSFLDGLSRDEAEKFNTYHEKYVYEKYIKRVKFKSKIRVFNNGKIKRERKVSFSKIAREYYELYVQHNNPLTVNTNEIKKKMEYILENYELLSEYLTHLSIENLKMYKFREVITKEAHDIQCLRYTAKDFGLYVGAILTNEEVNDALSRLYKSKGITKNPKRTILKDWFEVNDKKMVKGKFHYEILAEKK